MSSPFPIYKNTLLDNTTKDKLGDFEDPVLPIIAEPAYDIPSLKARTEKAVTKFKRLEDRINNDINETLNRVSDVLEQHNIKSERPCENYKFVIERYMNFKDDAIDIINLDTGNVDTVVHSPDNIRHMIYLDHDSDTDD